MNNGFTKKFIAQRHHVTEATLSITPEQALGGLGIAIEKFMQSDRNLSGATQGSIDLTLPGAAGR